MSNFLVNIFSISLVVSCIILVIKAFSNTFLNRYGAGLKQLLWLMIAFRMLIPVSFAEVVGPAYDYIVSVNNTDVRHLTDTYRNSVNTVFHEDLDEVDNPDVTAFDVVNEITETNASTENNDSFWMENINKLVGKIKLVYQEHLSIIFGLYWAGVCIFLFVHCLLYGFTCWRINKNAYPLGTEIYGSLIKNIYKEYGLDAMPDVYVTDCMASPMIMSISDTTIYLPKENYSVEELDAILRHELMHLKHKDLLIKRLYLLANALHWFNPFSYLMSAAAVKDMELYCDQDVVKYYDSEKRRQYNNILFGFLEEIGGFAVKHKFFTTSYQGDVEEMKLRFANNLDMRRKKKGIWPVAMLLAYVIVFTAIISFNVQDAVAFEFIDNSVEKNLPFYELDSDDIEHSAVSEEVMIYDSKPYNGNLEPEMLSDGSYLIPVIAESGEDYLFIQKFLVEPTRAAIQKIPEIEVYFDSRGIAEYGVSINHWPEVTNHAEENQFFTEQIKKHNDVFDIADCYSSDRSRVDVIFPEGMAPDVVQIEDFVLDDNGMSKYKNTYHELVYHNPIIEDNVKFYMNGHIAFNKYEPVYNVVTSRPYYRGINMRCYWVTYEGVQSVTYMFVIGNKNLDYSGER